MDRRVSVVIATLDRARELVRSLDLLCSLPEEPAVIVVDNGSCDGTPELVRRDFPRVKVIALGENLGAAARTVGVRAAATSYVAFSDDDSWWAPGSLMIAADRLDSHSRLGLIAARVLVGAEEALDPTCEAMAASPLPRRAGLPGTTVLGFLACGAIVRRSAFLDAGGFEVRFGVGGEEELLAIELASAGWDLVYCEDLIAHHHPSISAHRPGRRRRQCRNALWAAWLRRPLPVALRMTAHAAARGCSDPVAFAAFADALTGLAWAIRRRRPVSKEIEGLLKRLGH
ncbi:MAG: glycosyl transferase, family 2 [Planctomycetota bacterium]|nr:glycosyl transferase, family 2 [Planctomycetota bacterium]